MSGQGVGLEFSDTWEGGNFIVKQMFRKRCGVKKIADGKEVK